MYYLKKLFTNYKFIIIFILALIILFLTIFANKFAPYDPTFQDYNFILKKPSLKHFFGTDNAGRDIFSRVLYGGRSSLLISLFVTFLVAFIGIILGTVSGYFGGIIDTIIMRFVDIIMAFPYIVFIIAIISVFGVGTRNLILAMTLTSWTNHARVTRVMILSLKNNDFVKQAKLGGASNFQVVMRYLLPNILPSLIILTTQDIANNLLTLSSLSVLGIGVQPPTPEWGLMLTEGKKFMQIAPWILIFPGVAILICVIIFNLMGEILRDVLDPKN